MEANAHAVPLRPRAADVLTPEEVALLMRACSERSATGLRNRALIATFYRCGFRVSEAIALRAENVDGRTRTLQLRWGPRARTVGMDGGSFAFLKRWIERREQRRIAPSSPLFCTLGGGPLSASYIRALLPRLARKAGLERRVSAETLRRTLALELALEGFAVDAIQAQLGHASPLTTSRFVARVAPDGLAAVLRRRQRWSP